MSYSTLVTTGTAQKSLLSVGQRADFTNAGGSTAAGRCWQARGAGLVTHWSANGRGRSGRKLRDGVLRSILQKLQLNKTQAAADCETASSVFHTFSIDATTEPAFDPVALDTASLGELFAPPPTDLPPLPAAAPRPITTLRGQDRRAHPRHESGCIVSVLPEAASRNLSRDRIEWLLRSTELRGQLVDVSMTGLAMNLSRPLESNERISLRVSNPRFDHHVDCVARVLRCHQDPEEGWQIVCRFERSLSFQQLHQIGRHLFSSTIV